MEGPACEFKLARLIGVLFEGLRYNIRLEEAGRGGDLRLCSTSVLDTCLEFNVLDKSVGAK